MIHTPVLLKETVELLNVKSDGIYVDATIGMGGHAKPILERLDSGGLLIGIDCDEDAVAITRESLGKYGQKIKVFHGNFIQIRDFLKTLKINTVDGILLDLGVSGLQLTSPERGFSFQLDGRLDMRMDKRNVLTAEHVVNTYPQAELEEIFLRFGEERYTRVISRKIVKRRSLKPFKSTLELADTIKSAVPFYRRDKIHPATRVFQALRIYVNDELDNLQKVMETIPSLLDSSGRIAVISFHSLEDRIVKHSFKRENICRIVTPKPITPSFEEVNDNPRSRSAKLRVMEKM
jgi:16S rRNA (cytosine1402-N4)-methyltransferase